jgi:hypothetical protein
MRVPSSDGVPIKQPNIDYNSDIELYFLSNSWLKLRSKSPELVIGTALREIKFTTSLNTF